MSASNVPPAVLPLNTVASSSKDKAWMEVEKDAVLVAEDAIARKSKAAAFQPLFTDNSACNELIRSIAIEYEKVSLLKPNRFAF
jgi:hypothetical protein